MFNWISIPILFVILCVAGWFTHIIVSIQAQLWLLLLAGAIFFPIGIVHGIGSWFGLF